MRWRRAALQVGHLAAAEHPEGDAAARVQTGGQVRVGAVVVVARVVADDVEALDGALFSSSAWNFVLILMPSRVASAMPDSLQA